MNRAERAWGLLPRCPTFPHKRTGRKTPPDFSSFLIPVSIGNCFPICYFVVFFPCTLASLQVSPKAEKCTLFSVRFWEHLDGINTLDTPMSKSVVIHRSNSPVIQCQGVPNNIPGDSLG